MRSGGSLKLTGMPEGPGQFEFADLARSEKPLAEAGFIDIAASEITIEIRIDEGIPGLIRLMKNGSVRFRALYEAQIEEVRNGIPEALEELLVPHRDGSGIRLPAGLIVVSARRL